MTTLSERLRRPGADHGGISLFMAIAALAILVIIGGAIDGGGQLRAKSRATNIAAEAARTAGQAIDGGTAIPGGEKLIDPAAANQAAQAYLSAAGATGTVVVSTDRQQVTVTVEITHETVILSLIGIGNLTVTSQSTATLLTG